MGQKLSPGNILAFHIEISLGSIVWGRYGDILNEIDDALAGGLVKSLAGLTIIEY